MNFISLLETQFETWELCFLRFFLMRYQNIKRSQVQINKILLCSMEIFEVLRVDETYFRNLRQLNVHKAKVKCWGVPGKLCC